MKQYKGYYIDKVFFHSESDIDDLIKRKGVDRYKMLCTMFASKPSMELSVMMTDAARYLNKVCGLSYDEIEEIEVEAFEAA